MIHIYSIKPTCSQNNLAKSLLWIHLHQFQYLLFLNLLFAPALPELLWLPTAWRCPYIEVAFSTRDCSIVPTCGAWGSAIAAKRGPLKQSWAGIQHSRDGEPLGVLIQMRNARVNGFFFFSSLGVLPGVLVDTLSLCIVATFASNVCLLCYINSISSFIRNTADWSLGQAWGLMKSSYHFVTNVDSKCVNRQPCVV